MEPYRLFHAPRPGSLPHLHSMVDNIGYKTGLLAKYLDISPRTMRGYVSSGQAPRPVMLALFWETSWGTATTNAVAVNQTRRLFAENQLLKRQTDALCKQLRLLEKERELLVLASNAPFYRAR